jgi:glycosyltransferase involved in cell wall biosynthesis
VTTLFQELNDPNPVARDSAERNAGRGERSVFRLAPGLCYNAGRRKTRRVPTDDTARYVLVLPTYNERENLPALVAALRALPVALHVVVVDDNSPDGTGALADAFAVEGRLEVIHRPGKLGLGTAYDAGFRRALALGAELILTMDADFSHHPSYIPQMVDLAQRCDLVIGSRYVRGGGVRNWGAGRRALSRWANAVAHAVLGLQARDCTAGFRCYRRRVLETVDLTAIRADGYSYLIEMLYHCQRWGFVMGEVPIIFTDRQRGQSKISRREIWKAGGTVARLAGHRLARRPAAGPRTVAPAPLPQESQAK